MTPRRTQDRRAIEFSVRLLAKYRDANHGVTASTGIQGRKTMKVKNISAGIAGVILLIAVSLPQTAVAEDVEMNLRFAGSFITNSLPSALIDATAKGSPGKVEIRGFGGVDQVFGFDPMCLGSPGFRIDILENPLVFKFQDLSLLFAKNGNGTICARPTGIDFEINLMFDGGRGRYAGATGNAVITGEAEAINIAGTFLAETGTIVGTIIVPDDDDDDSDSD